MYRFFCMCCLFYKCECHNYWCCSACCIPCCTPLSSSDLDSLITSKNTRTNTGIAALKRCINNRERCINCMNDKPWEKCGDCWKKCWTVFTNIASLIIFLAFVSYLSQALPAIVISYYLSPTASLIRLGFIEVIIVVMLFEVSYLLFLLDKCTWLSYFNKHKKIPKEIIDDHIKDKATNNNEHLTFISQYIDKEKNELIYSDYFQSKHCCNEIKHCHWLFVLTCIQIFTMLFITIISAILLFFLLNVVIQETSGSDNQFKDILAIVPTIALNLWLLSRHINLGEAVKNIATEANKNIHHDSAPGAQNNHVQQQSPHDHIPITV